MSAVPEIRLHRANDSEINQRGNYVLYWMTAYRRTFWNFSLQRAAHWARELNKPLLILEALRCDYPWASERLHRFVLDGMADNARDLEGRGATYYPYVEPSLGEGRGLLPALATQACMVVTDEFPCFFLPSMVAAAARQISVCLEQVDSNGLMPLRASNRVFLTAYSFRRFLQAQLHSYLETFPEPDPLAGHSLPNLQASPRQILRRWPRAHLPLSEKTISSLPLNRQIGAAPIRGGQRAALVATQEFLQERIRHYDSRNQPEQEVTSGLSPYLHFGHISSHQVFRSLIERENWDSDNLYRKASGSRSGWWGLSPSAEAFLDQLITWRELGFNMCHLRQDYDRFESLPEWAQKTLDKHSQDPRPYRYTQEQLEGSLTHDSLWNAAQGQLLREGGLHNYLRMLWGKKILEWSPHPREALQVMIELNNKYALDGRDPSSYSGIFWCLGRYDRPWGPERPIFGTVRYMSSENTARKVRVKNYIQRYGGDGGQVAPSSTPFLEGMEP